MYCCLLLADGGVLLLDDASRRAACLMLLMLLGQKLRACAPNTILRLLKLRLRRQEFLRLLELKPNRSDKSDSLR